MKDRIRKILYPKLANVFNRNRLIFGKSDKEIKTVCSIKGCNNPTAPRVEILTGWTCPEYCIDHQNYDLSEHANMLKA